MVSQDSARHAGVCGDDLKLEPPTVAFVVAASEQRDANRGECLIVSPDPVHDRAKLGERPLVLPRSRRYASRPTSSRRTSADTSRLLLPAMRSSLGRCANEC